MRIVLCDLNSNIFFFQAIIETVRTNSKPTCWYLNWQLECSNSMGSSYNFCLVSNIFSFPFTGRKYRLERKCFLV